MQSNRLIAIQNADITRYPYPYPDFKPDLNNQVTIGDLHANALKLLHFLVFQNVLVMPAEDYYALTKIYLVDENTTDDYKAFGDILDRATVQPVGMVRLIGDELADRGKNDYFILKIIEKLSKSKVPFEILYSNHGAEFYAAFTGYTFIVLPEWDYQRRSLNQLQNKLEQGIINKKEVQEIVEKHYLPNVKLISYSIDETTASPTLTLYTHAAVGLETLEALAKLYNVKYQEESLELLCNTIDKINIAFKKTNPSTTMKYECRRNNSDLNGPVSAYYPLMRITWSRSLSYVVLPYEQNGYALRLVHGHEGTFTSITRNNVTCLDVSNLGKISNQPDLYYSLYSQDKLTFKKPIVNETTSEQKSVAPDDVISIKFWDEEDKHQMINITAALTAESKHTPAAPEVNKTLIPAKWEIPMIYWDQKQHPVIQDRIKNTITLLKEHVDKREKSRRFPWFSLFRSSDSSGAEKLAKELQTGSGQFFNRSEIVALKAEPVGQMIKDLANDGLLPEQLCSRY